MHEKIIRKMHPYTKKEKKQSQKQPTENNLESHL